MNHFVTIATASHLCKVKALADSLQQNGPGFVMHVLVTDSQAVPATANLKTYSLSDINTTPVATAIINKYQHQPDKLRWSMKPVMMKHVLETAGADKVIYLDNDLFFYAGYSFLFDALEEHSFLLTPHYYKNSFEENQNWLEANFRLGLFNAGFVGANSKALNSLQWWADCCLYRCEKNAWRGLFDDQKYLDLIPVKEPTALILRHRGCNLGGWNKELCKRELIDGKLYINGQYPVVFIHFNSATVREIVEGRDPLLAPHHQAYVQSLKKHKPDFNEQEIYAAIPFSQQLKLGIWKIITALDM